ncbi:hypothetical protein LTR05_001099 [Lithohypha guttulata]|uniref:mRNA export factor GLE1 n=1 Tax=Lithohypha guttulata TaxID=1690604 RepID=A0AAN7T8I7_9EURO|nr:hypothetical protein LTR05_001099 [Lithohypha guttulata]
MSGADGKKTSFSLEQAFEELRLRDAEVQKLHAFQRKLQANKTEERESELAIEHSIILQRARNERDAVRQEAEDALKRHLHEQEQERRRRAEEEELRVQRELQKNAERDREIREEQERLRKAEEEKARVEAQRLRDEQERAKAATKEREKKEDQQRREQQERQRLEAARKQAEADAQQKAQKAADHQRETAAAATASSPERIHQEYVDLYLKLKAWKNNFWEDLRTQAKTHKNPSIKSLVSDVRSTIRSEVGKLNAGDKEVNKLATTKLKARLTEALQSPAPVAAYFICVLAQQVVKIFTSYVHGAPERAEPIGIMLTSIFALKELQFPRQGSDLAEKERSQSLFPIFLAKYHRVCPALFGISANQGTLPGKQRLGWAMLPAADEGASKTTFVSDQTHYDRMTGLAIGYSSFALRNFSAASVSNPYPPVHFWKSLAQIINMSPELVQPTHVCILRHMFGSGGIGRFLLFFGAVGVAVLREAYVEFPKRLPEAMKKDSFVLELDVFVTVKLGEKEHLHLV